MLEPLLTNTCRARHRCLSYEPELPASAWAAGMHSPSASSFRIQGPRRRPIMRCTQSNREALLTRSVSEESGVAVTRQSAAVLAVASGRYGSCSRLPLIALTNGPEVVLDFKLGSGVDRIAHSSCRLNATNASPAFVLSLPAPPAAMTTYWRPLT